MGMFDKEMREMRGKLVKWVNNATKFLKKEVEKRTPEDTKRLLKSNKIVAARPKWDTIVWAVENATPYAAYVEFWVRSRRYNYHKPKWTVFYRWVWARMFTRAKNDNQDAVKKIIENALSD